MSSARQFERLKAKKEFKLWSKNNPTLKNVTFHKFFELYRAGLVESAKSISSEVNIAVTAPEVDISEMMVSEVLEVDEDNIA